MSDEERRREERLRAVLDQILAAVERNREGINALIAWTQRHDADLELMRQEVIEHGAALERLRVAVDHGPRRAARASLTPVPKIQEVPNAAAL